MLLALSYYASHSNKLKQMVGVAINTYLVAVAQREGLALSYYASHSSKLKQIVGVAINTYLVAQTAPNIAAANFSKSKRTIDLLSI